MSEEKGFIYTWRGKDIETLSTEETKEALRTATRDLIRERAMRMQDAEMMQIFARLK